MNDFKKYIEFLKADLFQAAKDAAPENVINAKARHLKRVEEYHERVETYIQDLELDYYLDTESLRQRITMLEAILLIHGINDFPVYMSKGSDYLQAMALEMNAKGVSQLPAAVNDVLTDQQRSEILNYIRNGLKRSNA